MSKIKKLYLSISETLHWLLRLHDWDYNKVFKQERHTKYKVWIRTCKVCGKKQSVSILPTCNYPEVRWVDEN